MINKMIEILEEQLFELQLEKTATVVRLYHKDSIMFQHKMGFSDLEEGIAADYNTIFPISSMTKQFTAALIFLLKEDGLLQYKDPITKYLDDFPEYGKQLTVGHLLHQTSGLMDPYTYYFDNNLNTDGITNKEVYDLLIQQNSLLFSPGEKFQYCNSNYILLSLIAEKITGENFSTLLGKRIFEKVGMLSTELYQNESSCSDSAKGYKKIADREYQLLELEWLTYGDGGIHSSLNDLGKWYSSLSDNTFNIHYAEEAFVSGKNNQNEEIGYGLGWFISESTEGRIVYHLGGDPGYGSMILLIPEKDIGLIIFSNLDETWKLFNEIFLSIRELFIHYSNVSRNATE